MEKQNRELQVRPPRPPPPPSPRACVWRRLLGLCTGPARPAKTGGGRDGGSTRSKARRRRTSATSAPAAPQRRRQATAGKATAEDNEATRTRQACHVRGGRRIRRGVRAQADARQLACGRDYLQHEGADPRQLLRPALARRSAVSANCFTRPSRAPLPCARQARSAQLPADEVRAWRLSEGVGGGAGIGTVEQPSFMFSFRRKTVL